jgi:hypothetical protein
LSDGAPQTRHPLRSAAWRHSVRVLLFVICSCFGPEAKKSQGEQRRLLSLAAILPAHPNIFNALRPGLPALCKNSVLMA